MRTLVIDVGGTHVKILVTGRRKHIQFDSGPKLTAGKMAAMVKSATASWQYDRVSIGYPGPASHGRPVANPHNLGGGWVGFDFRKAFGKPVKLVNDASMQALGSHKGGHMLFLGLGTGLGSALIVNGTLVPTELAHLPYRKGKTFEDYMGIRGLRRLGKRKWRKHVAIVVEKLRVALQADYVVLGGGNTRLLKKLPPKCVRGNNDNAFLGGFRLWETAIPSMK